MSPTGELESMSTACTSWRKGEGRGAKRAYVHGYPLECTQVMVQLTCRGSVRISAIACMSRCGAPEYLFTAAERSIIRASESVDTGWREAEERYASVVE